MSAENEPEETSEPGEPGGMSEQTARIVLAVVLLLAMWGIVAAVPEAAYVVVGVGACLGGQRARRWWQRHRHGDEEDGPEDDASDVGTALRALSGSDRNHVLLTALQTRIGAPDTKAVRELLAAADIRVRPGVRTPAGNGPGIHVDDIPAPSPDVDRALGGGCCCRSATNTNANNAPTNPTEKGLRVETIGQAGFALRDPAETAHRRHTA